MQVADHRFFTEQVLLNNTILDWICPPNCEKNKISQVGESILETLVASKNDPFSNNLKGKYHLLTKPIKAVARVAFIGLVLLTVSPLGTVYYGTLTLKNLSEYTFNKIKGLNSENPSQAACAERIKAYGKAFFSDLSCFTVGLAAGSVVAVFGSSAVMYTKGLILGIPVGVGANATTTLLGKVCMVAFAIFGTCIGVDFLGAFSPSRDLARLLANQELRTPLYLSLEMRNQLGLVSQDGKFLKFSKADKIEFNTTGFHPNVSFQFKGHAKETLQNLICNAELDFLDYVIEANQWMKKNKMAPIPFAHPFNGKTIVKQLKAALKTIDKGSSAKSEHMVLYNPKHKELSNLIANLEKMTYKIQTFRSFFHTSLLLAVQDPLFLELLSYLGNQHRTVTITELASYVNPSYYQNYFNNGISSGAGSHSSSRAGQRSNGGRNTAQEKTLHEFYQQIELTPNSTQSNVNTPYNLFKSQLLEQVSALQNNKPVKKFHELLGLNSEYTHDEKKKALRALALELHPDRQNNSEEANKLFQYFVQIRTEIESPDYIR